ncbi:hypothetical protein [Actinomadura xylanilytica]|uniref:hypothetical protein n=1 Tax=Actinomadura xylanilytica TaxID=887459 RepID=UPI00255A7D14|nr:hypothetical protein [Actinomadura xylanilytica]MDL4770861.1 hypothetical protein [Actinomadura xylanilytica]
MRTDGDDDGASDPRGLPPAGYLRSAPRPAGRRRGRRLLLGTGLTLVAGAFGLGVSWAASRTAPVPPAATPSVAEATASPEQRGPTAAPRRVRPMPAGPVPAGSGPARGNAPARAVPSTRAPTRVPATGRRSPPASRAQPRHRPRHRPVSRAPRPRQHPPRETAARPPAQAPGWIGPECRRRFPGDPGRRGACVAALTRQLGG